jgi:hypothetical protein
MTEEEVERDLVGACLGRGASIVQPPDLGDEVGRCVIPDGSAIPGGSVIPSEARDPFGCAP